MTVVILLLLIVGWTFAGCDKHARYQVLSIVFDGVPNPDEPTEKTARKTSEMAMNEQPKNAAASPSMSRPPSKSRPQSPSEPQSQPRASLYRHPPPDGTDDCSFCHGSVSRMVIPPRDICVKCHTHVHEKHRFVHGPAAVDCVACHNIHESRTKTLLAKTAPQLCFNCHDQEALKSTDAHAGAGELECLSCHDPHGGNDRFFLK